MIKILHKKMLNVILYLYWCNNDTSAKNNSLIGYSNEPSINGKKLVISYKRALSIKTNEIL